MGSRSSECDSGQFVLGEPLNRRNQRHKLRLRTVSELFPEVIQGDLDADGLPSCSAAEALDRQEPFVNPTLANHALALLVRLFRYAFEGLPILFHILELASARTAFLFVPLYPLPCSRVLGLGPPLNGTFA